MTEKAKYKLFTWIINIVILAIGITATITAATYELAMLFTCITGSLGTLGYIFFHEIKPKRIQNKNKKFFPRTKNTDQSTNQLESCKIFEDLKSSEYQATFKGNHRTNEDQPSLNEKRLVEGTTKRKQQDLIARLTKTLSAKIYTAQQDASDQLLSFSKTDQKTF